MNTGKVLTVVWTLLSVCFQGPVQGGTVRGCTTHLDCQYDECTTRPGYDTTDVDCFMDYWATDGLVCRNSRPEDLYGYVYLVYTACPVGLCNVGERMVVREYRDLCLPCGAGTFSDVRSTRTTCDVCPAGKYQGVAGASECVDCPPGTYGVSTGMTSLSDGCIPCAKGYYSSGYGSTECVSCTSGEVNVIPSGYYRMKGCMDSAVSPPENEPCEVCDGAHGSGSRPCTSTSPAQCGVVKCASNLLGLQPDYTGDWLTEDYKCGLGEYLRGFNTSEDKDCRRCPADMVGRDGVKCEWCQGPLEEPYALDQSDCVCKASAVMNRSGGCECEDGWRFNATSGVCEPCPLGTYGEDGQCYDCGAGTFSGIPGATVCEECAVGTYRVVGQSGEGCRVCDSGPGHYAPWPWNDTCVSCNRSCVDGLKYAGPCPDGGTGFVVCVPCETNLPTHGSWVQGGGCVYTCNAGYYFSEWDMGECRPCSVEPCPAGLQGRACTEYEDKTCDTECSNTSKPIFHSKWTVGGISGGACPWECEPGYSAKMTDYLLFQIHECVPSGDDDSA